MKKTESKKDPVLGVANYKNEFNKRVRTTTKDERIIDHRPNRTAPLFEAIHPVKKPEIPRINGMVKKDSRDNTILVEVEILYFINIFSDFLVIQKFIS